MDAKEEENIHRRDDWNGWSKYIVFGYAQYTKS